MMMNVALSVAALVATAQSASISMRVYYDPTFLCRQDQFNSSYPAVQTLTVNLPYAPSCIEIYNFLDQTNPPSTTVPGDTKCFSSTANLGYAQNIGLFNSLGGGNPGGNLYYGATGNFTAFKITACSEGSAALKLYREPDTMTAEDAKNCFWLPGTTNDTSTLPALRDSEQITLNFNSFSISTVTPEMTVNEYNLGSSSFSTSGYTWSLNYLASGLERTVQTTVGEQIQNIFNMTNNYTFIYDLDDMNSIVQYYAPRVTLTLSGTSVYITPVRNLSATPREMWLPNAGCSMKYTVMQKSGGRDWGAWFSATPASTNTASLSRISVGKATTSTLTQQGFGYPLLVKTVDNGCLDKCTENIEITTMGTGYNPAYSQGSTLMPYSINSRCYSGTYSSSGYCSTPFVVSKYSGTDCLCGQLEMLSFPLTYIPAYSGAADATMLTASVTDATLTGLANPVNDLVFNYTVGSGTVLGSSSGQAENYAGYLAGSIIGSVIAAVVFIVLFFVFSKPLGDTSKTHGKSFVEKTMSPLSGVQLVLIFLATACAFAAALSPEAVTVLIQQGATVAIDTYSVGIWLRIESNGNVGTLSGSTARFTSGNPNSGNMQYSCNFYILSDVTTGGNNYNFDQVHACTAVRAGSSIAVVAGVAAVGVAFFKRQRLVLPLVILAALGSVIALGTFKAQTVDVWLESTIPDYNTYAYGNGFHLMIAAVFFFLLEILAWIIDWLSMEAI
eukprot:m.157795 g.157795  ORF g.157795 m.157795 type:complete len:728 (+) comp31067_c1_seq1:52-2235(+)